MRRCLLSASVLVAGAVAAQAQLSSNPDKFLGNITTAGRVDYGKEAFHTLWNQITCENESKWASIEGGARGSFSWTGSDAAYNYARKWGFPFKFHTLIWGGQYPGWMDRLSTKEQYKAVVEWMDAIQKHYPDLEMIDVVNEAVPGHAPAPYKEALGGDGVTGYDWIIKAFEMAHERWPNAILIYNDYNTFQWNRAQYIDLVQKIRDAGAPVDAYGCQSHDLTDMNVNDFKAAMREIQNALKMPMYSTEYDIGTADDDKQEQRFKEQIPVMWESDYCAGITFWGYIYGHTWVTDGNSGFIKDGVDRPAMTWLREYMQSDAAKKAKSPFPGMKKEASLYIKPQSIITHKDIAMPITVSATLRTKTIDHIDFYVKGQLYKTLTEAPYELEYTPEALGKYDLKAVLTATDGSTYERWSSFTAYPVRAPYKNAMASLPGTLQVENFDQGAPGESYYDTDGTNQSGNTLRSDAAGVDVGTGNGSAIIGYTQTGEWLEYTVDVREDGYYNVDAVTALGNSNPSSLQLSLHTDQGLVTLTDTIRTIFAGEGIWNQWKTTTTRTLIPLQAGTNIIRLTWVQGGCDVDKLVFSHVDLDDQLQIALTTESDRVMVGSSAKFHAEVSSPTSEIANVKFYIDQERKSTDTTDPYEYTFRPTTATALGRHVITAVATDSEGRQSVVAEQVCYVDPKRTPYKNKYAVLPGDVEAENFDVCGEGYSYHDSDTKNEGGAAYRTDAPGVDIKSANGGKVVGYTAVGEWLEYTVDVQQAGKYTCEALCASGTTGSSFQVSYKKEDGKYASLWTISVAKTADNSWDTYKTFRSTLKRELPEGKLVLRITIKGANCDIDKLTFTCVEPDAIDEVGEDVIVTPVQTYSLSGLPVGRDYKGVVIRGGKKYIQK